jgi:tyrosyl-tRNA synthetase
MPENLYDVLAERGLVAQCTDPAIRERLSRPLTCYIGFDPTADSLHIGSLVPLMTLAWMQRGGHRPLAVIGGATGLVGDPAGKSEQRKLLDREEVQHNVAGLRAQVGLVLSFDAGPTGARLLDNAEWLADLHWIDLLREVGACLSVNRMLTLDSVKGRMVDGGGITFLEFNYMVMQAYDFLHLYRVHGCTLQLGGQDQWGNILMGIELGRRLAGAELAGLTQPLVTRSDGGKFGKTESGTIWLTAARTTPYLFYQFWRNVADADVARFLAFFTFLPMDEVRRLTSRPGQALNEAKEVLADDLTTRIHGAAAAAAARDDSRRAFAPLADAGGDSIPHAPLATTELEAGVGLLTLLVRAGLAASNGEARRLVQGGGVRLHDERVDDPTRQITAADLRSGHLLLRAGRKRLFRFDAG